MNTKKAWSKINAIAESMLEDKNKCDGCIFYNYFECADKCLDYISCNHRYNYNDIEDKIDINKRPKDCPIRWRYNKKPKEVESSEYDYRDLEDYL